MTDTCVRDRPVACATATPAALRVAMQSMEARTAAVDTGPQAHGGERGVVGRVRAVHAQRRAMWARNCIRDEARVGRGSFARVFVATSQRTGPPPGATPSAPPEMTQWPAGWSLGPNSVAIKALVMPPVHASHRVPLRKRVPRHGDNSDDDTAAAADAPIPVDATVTASPVPSDIVCDDDDDDEDGDEDGGSGMGSDAGDPAEAYVSDEDAECDAQTVLDEAYTQWDAEVRALTRLGANVTKPDDAVAPRLAPWLTARATLTIGMDVAVCNLRQLPEWLATYAQTACGSPTRPPDRRLMATWRDTEALIYSVFACVAAAHARGIAHCDLVAHNVLVYAMRDTGRDGDLYLQLRIGDWGSSHEIDPETGFVRWEPSDGAVGAPHYLVSRSGRPPELIVCDSAPIGAAIDVWGAGIIAALLVHRMPDGVTVFPGTPDTSAAVDDDDDGASNSSAVAAARLSGFGGSDLLRAMVRKLGAPAPQSFMAPLVSDYVSMRPTRMEAHSAAFAALSKPRVPGRAPGAYAEIARATSARSRHTTSTFGEDDVAHALRLDDFAAETANVWRTLRRTPTGRALVDDASCDVRTPQSIKRLIYHVLQWEPAARPTAAEVCATARFWSRPVTELAAHRVYAHNLLPHAWAHTGNP